MQKVLVTGNAGAGKTSLALVLAAHLQLPYIGLDSVVWRPGWSRTPKEERQEKERLIANGAAWVVDGVSDVMLQSADTVIFLDYPRRRCFWRVLLRNLPYLFRSRPGLPERCPEILIIPTLIKIIWRFPHFVRPKVLAGWQDTGKRFVHIRNNAELEKFLLSIGITSPNKARKSDALKTRARYKLVNNMNLRESLGLILLVTGAALVPLGWIVSHKILVLAAIALALGGWLFYTERILKREAKLVKEGGLMSGGPAMPADINNSTGWRTGGRTETIESTFSGGDADGD